MPAASSTITENPSYLYWDHTPLDFTIFYLFKELFPGLSMGPRLLDTTL